MQAEGELNVIYGGDQEEPSGEVIDYASLGEMIVQDLKLGQNKTSYINGSSGEIWTFRDMLESSQAVTKGLIGSGIGQNDVISIIAENICEFPAITFGAFYLNTIVAPINVTYSIRELSHALELSKPKLVFVSQYAAKRAIAACKQLSYVKNVIVIGGKSLDSYVISLKDFTKKHEKVVLNLEAQVSKKVNTKDQVALIMCSSGTTGMPKGVMLTHANIISVVQGYRDRFVLYRMVYDQTLIILNVSPWFHSMGFMSMFLIATSRDAISVFLPKFEEELFLKAIEKYKVTTITVVPPIMVFLAKSPLVDKYDISSVKDIGCGAAALSGDIENQVMERFKGDVTIRQGYGMSETTLGTLGSDAIIKPGSVGQPVKGVYAKIIDEDGKALGPNQRGELCFRGNLLMKGYINDPKATSDTIDKDGWLHSGDIAYYDEEFQFYIVDRLKELIKYKAFQVPPAEIEALLLSNPKIKDCGVIGIPNEESGELPFAYVVKQPGVDLSEQDVQKFVADNSSKTKWLHGGVKFIDEIPKTPSGKILRREMRDLYKTLKPKL